MVILALNGVSLGSWPTPTTVRYHRTATGVLNYLDDNGILHD